MEARPFESAAILAYPTRADWDAVAVELLGTMIDRWQLTRVSTFRGGYSGTVIGVTQADGSPAVLKVGFPHPEAIFEAVAMQSFPPGTSPAILRQDPWTWAMLLQRVDPGTPLSAASLSPDEAVRLGTELLARVSAPPPTRAIPALGDVVHDYARVARSRLASQLSRLDSMNARELVEEAIDELDDLAESGVSTAMVHGDFNPGNILRSGSEWVVVDPKPMIGDSCYDVWPLISQIGAPFGGPDPESVLRDRVRIAADVLSADPERVTRWAFARTGLNVSWYLEEGSLALATRDAEELRVWARVRRPYLRGLPVT